MKNGAIEKNSDKTTTVKDETNSNSVETSEPSVIAKPDTKEVEQPKPITPQTIAEVEKKVSAADKSKVIQIIMSKLTSGDISRLKALVKGGMTPAKTAQAKAIIKARISSQDIEELKQLASKYSGSTN